VGVRHLLAELWRSGSRGTGGPALELEDLGVIAVQLALSFPEWVRRRRFIVSYVDDTTIQQRMSVDFVLPEADWFWSTITPQPGSTIYAPLYLPAKETLDQFTAYDEERRHLPMLPTADNGALAVAGLLPLVRGLARERLSPGRLRQVLPGLEAELTSVVMASKRDGAPTTDQVLESALSGALGEILTEEDETKAVVRDLAGGFLMLVPVTYRPREDRLLKAEWDIPNYWIGQRGAKGPMRWAQSALASVAWADKRQNIPNLQIGWARSTHVEIVSPPDVEMTGVSLRARQYDGRYAQRGPVGTTRSVFNKPRATLNVAPRAAASLLDRDPVRRETAAKELLQARGDIATVEVRFRSPASGVLVAATIASVMLSVLMWVASEHLGSLDRQTFSAVLLVFPAILAAYLLRPGEHAFARRLLAGVRLCGLGVAVCSVGMSAMLGVATLTEPEAVPASAGVRHFSCVTRNLGASSRPTRSSLTCRSEFAAAVTDRPSVGTRRWTRRIAAVASLLTAILAIGLLRTWLWSDLRNRRKTDRYTEHLP
jgi:hypothetical protein